MFAANCRPNYGILHITGRVDKGRGALKSAGKGKAGPQAEFSSPALPMLLVGTMSEHESTACQW